MMNLRKSPLLLDIVGVARQALSPVAFPPSGVGLSAKIKNMPLAYF